jgi:hypothetical protein
LFVCFISFIPTFAIITQMRTKANLLYWVSLYIFPQALASTTKLNPISLALTPKAEFWVFVKR